MSANPTNEQLIAALYVGLFGRAPEYNGLHYWLDKMNRGESIDQIATGFTQDSTYKFYFGNKPNADFVTTLYHNILGRDPIGNDIAYWTGQIDQYGQDKVAAMFVKSALTDDVNAVGQSSGWTAQQIQAAQAAQDTFLHKVNVGVAFSNVLGRDKTILNVAGFFDPSLWAADPVYKAAQDILKIVSSDPTSEQNALQLIQQAAAKTTLQDAMQTIESGVSAGTNGGTGDTNTAGDIGSAGSSTMQNDFWAHLNASFQDMAFDGSSVFVAGNGNPGWQSGRGYDVWVAKLDVGLNVQKTVWLGDANNQAVRSVADTGDGGVVVTGYQYVSGEQKEFISKLDANLNAVGTVTIGATGTSEQINDVAVRPDGKIVAVGDENAVADAQDAYIVLLNPDMTVFAQRRVDNPNVLNSKESFGQVVVLPDNSVVARAGMVLEKFDADLNLVKTVQTNAGIKDMAVTSDGSIWLLETSRLVQLTSDLQWAGEWLPNFRAYNLTADGSTLTLYGSSAAVTVDVAQGAPVIEDVTQVSTRSGGAVYFGQAALKNGTLEAWDGGHTLMTLRPGAAVSPNLASDYRENELDVGAYALNAVTSYKTMVTPLEWAEDEVQIVGVATSYTTKDASGLVTVDARGTLDA